MQNPAQPAANCELCPRLAAFRADNAGKHPDFHNAPVPSFGSLEAPLLIAGLAPGLKGANRTGRPFTGDYAGDLLYATLLKFGLAEGRYAARADDGLQLRNCRITNVVRCVPPENKPVGAEIAACRNFLSDEIAAMKNLRIIVALGTVSHNAVLGTLGARKSAYKFGHGVRHEISANGRALILADSYHCSRYNTNTGRLTTAMFEAVLGAVAADIAG